MVDVKLKANKRKEVGKKVKKLRQQGFIPAVVYGHKIDSTALLIEAKEFKSKVLKSEAGTNLIFSLNLTDDGEKKVIPVITHRIQRDVLTDDILHIDFMNILMDEKIKTKISIELVGTPVGVKEEGGVLVHNLHSVEIKCFPGDIPTKFELDVSGLNINESLHISDIKVSNKVEIQAPAEEMVAQVSPPTKEEVEAPPVLTPEEAAAAAEAAGEGAAPAEGEAAPAGEAKENKPAAEAKPAAEKK